VQSRSTEPNRLHRKAVGLKSSSILNQVDDHYDDGNYEQEVD
jgi:hypothetical protein